MADVVIDRPRVHINLPQLRQEDRDKVDVEDRGWQDAFQSIYPLKFNRVQVRNGDFVYIDEDPKRPLQLSRINLIAENIRNIRDDKAVYPSPVRADGVLFGKGRGVVDGHADFLSEPYPGVHVLYQLEHVPLERLDGRSPGPTSTSTAAFSPRGARSSTARSTGKPISRTSPSATSASTTSIAAATAAAEKERAAQARPGRQGRPAGHARPARPPPASRTAASVWSTGRPTARFRVFVSGTELRR